MQNQVAQPQSSRSTLVTVVAWIFIVLAGFSTFISVLQNIMVNTMVPLDQMHASVGPGTEQMPVFFRFVFGHIQLFVFAFLVVSSTTLIAAIGLLRRKNWARLLFIGILAVGILWNITGLVLQQVMFSSMATFPAAAPQDFRTEFDHMATVMQVFSVFMAVGLSALFAWLIKRLFSGPIRAEFTQAL
jgi:hypothetical protein